MAYLDSRAPVVMALFALIGCSSASTDGSDGGGGHGTTTSSSTSGSSTSSSGGGADDCPRGTLESDFDSTPPVGPNVDPKTGKLIPLPSTAVVSTTYLRLKGDATAQKRFGELVAPIKDALQTQPGLLVLQLGTSATCGTARTLSVWQDEASMIAFAMGDAHAAAEASVGEVSRSGSTVTKWEPTGVDDATWESAAKHLAASQGPFF